VGNSHGLAYPFHLYSRALFEQLGLVVREIQSNSFSDKRQAWERFEGDIALVAPPQREPDGRMVPREQIAEFFLGLPRKEGTRLVLFDVSDSPTGRHFELAPDVDLYAMSFTYTDPEEYQWDYVIGNKFADFMSRHYGLEPTESNEYWPGLFDSKLAEDQIPKLFTLHRIGSRKRMHRYYREQGRRCLPHGERRIDVNCRFREYSGWCRVHRFHVREVLNALGDEYRVIATEEKVPAPQYHAELSDSKILFSPFGWGEFCPKDWEAFLKGCLLMKPSVEHVKTFPRILVPFETYVPVKWDLSDVPEKVKYYLANETERRRIVANAARVVQEFYDEATFVGMVRDLMIRLGLPCETHESR
jgi:hypothetical protein